MWKKNLCTDILKSTVTRVPFIWRLWPHWYVQRTMHALSWYFLRIDDIFLKKKNVVKQCFFTITTRHHTNPYNPSKSTSVVSWRLPDTAVLLPGLGSISKMLSSLTLYQFYILHCIYRKKKGQRGRKNHGLMYSRRGNKEKVIAIAFKISTHLASIVAYSITYIQVLEQV